MRHFFLFITMLLAFGRLSAADFPEIKVHKISGRVYALLGPTEVPSKDNRGYANNNLAILGNQGVILVDAGSHKDIGQHIKRTLQAITPKPVTHVLITHHHADHHLGLSAFADAKIIATDKCAEEISKNGASMLGWMRARTGLALADTRSITPATVIPAKSRQAMVIDGVKLELIGTETAHTQGDMLVWLPDDGVLAAGDILVHTINPNFADGDLKKWVGVVKGILDLPLKTVLPGHGPLMSRGQVEVFGDLISDFYKTVDAIYKAGGSESDVRKKLDMARWQKLGRFEEMMGSNISTVWRQVESDNF